MSEDARPPVAIRITRPQATEDEFLEQELETLSRASVTLLGAQARPQGVVLRFELALSSGLVLLRGEGRVTGFKPNALHGLGGLTLRFTRLDSKSKALVDKANALREQRRPSVLPAAPEPAPSGPLPPAPMSSEPAVGGAAADSSPPDSSPTMSDPEPFRGARAGLSAGARASGAGSSEREALLDRLRARAKTLDGGDVARILEQRRRA